MGVECPLQSHPTSGVIDQVVTRGGSWKLVGVMVGMGGCRMSSESHRSSDVSTMYDEGIGGNDHILVM